MVSSSVLSELVSEASMVCSWNEDRFLKCLVQTSLVLTSLVQTSLVQTSVVQIPLVQVHHPLAELRWMEPYFHQ